MANCKNLVVDGVLVEKLAGKGAVLKRTNLGLNLLRIVLTLGVIMDHFWWMPDPENLSMVGKALWQLRTLAVPAFMTMTFFFTAKRFVSGDTGWLKQRFLRLYEPFVFWAFVCFAGVELVSLFDPKNYPVSVTDLLWQLFLGHSEHLSLTQFWFHIDLIVLTAVFFALFRLVRSAKANVYLAFGAIAVGYTVQYCQPLMLMLFGDLPFEAKYPLGRVFTMLPYAGAGLLLAAAKDRIDVVPTGVRVAIAAMGVWLMAWVIYAPVAPRPAGVVGYEGVNMSLIAWGMMALFYYIPFDRLPAWCGTAVAFLSRYCMGVYCIHHLMGKILFDLVFRLPRLETKWGGLAVAPWWFWLLLWVLSYLVCWLISLIPGRFSKRIVE